MFQIIYAQKTDYGLNDCRIPTDIDQPVASFAIPHTLITHEGLSPRSLSPKYLSISQYCKTSLSSDFTDLRPHPLLQTITLNAEYVVAFVPSLSRVAVLNHATVKLLARLPLNLVSIDEDTAQALYTMHQIGLITDGDGTIACPAEPQTLAAWLHVTNACNLRCSYCYIRKTSETMSEATAYAAIDTIIRSARQHGYQQIALKYAGGEATLHMALIEAMHTYALEQAVAHKLRIRAGMLSNGTLLSGCKVETIKQLGLQLMISLDGAAEIHDAQRPTIAGRGSFAATLAGIEQALDAGVKPTISITVTGQSVVGLPSLVSWLLERGLAFTINFYRQHDNTTTQTQLQLDEQRIIAGMRETYAVIERNPPPWSILGALIDRADLSTSHSRTCAVGEHYLVIDHHGRIAKCQMTIDQSVTTIDAADPLTLIRADQIGIQNVPVDQKEGCRTCKWRYWCAGGCAVATYRATGRYDIQSPNCAIYKDLYPDLVCLEGLRLLHWYEHSLQQAELALR